MELLININLDNVQVQRLAELAIFALVGLLAIVLILRPLIRAVATRGYAKAGGGQSGVGGSHALSGSSGFGNAGSKESFNGASENGLTHGGDGTPVNPGFVRVSVVVPETSVDAIQRQAGALRAGRAGNNDRGGSERTPEKQRGPTPNSSPRNPAGPGGNGNNRTTSDTVSNTPSNPPKSSGTATQQME